MTNPSMTPSRLITSLRFWGDDSAELCLDIHEGKIVALIGSQRQFHLGFGESRGHLQLSVFQDGELFKNPQAGAFLIGSRFGEYGNRR